MCTLLIRTDLNAVFDRGTQCVEEDCSAFHHAAAGVLAATKEGLLDCSTNLLSCKQFL